MKPFPDTDTVRLAAQGNPQATREVLRLLARWLPGVVARRHSVEIGQEDLCQDVLIQVHRGLRGLREPERFRSWVHGVIRNRGAERMKEVRRQAVTLAAVTMRSHTPCNPTNPETEAGVLEMWRVGQLAMDTLEPSLREVYALYLEEHSLTEMAEILEIPRGTASSRLRRARMAVTGALARLGHGQPPGEAEIPDVLQEGR